MNKTDIPGGLIKPMQMAAILGVSVRTVQRLADEGKLPHYRVGAQLRFDPAETVPACRAEVS